MALRILHRINPEVSFSVRAGLPSSMTENALRSSPGGRLVFFRI